MSEFCIIEWLNKIKVPQLYLGPGGGGGGNGWMGDLAWFKKDDGGGDSENVFVRGGSPVSIFGAPILHFLDNPMMALMICY